MRAQDGEGPRAGAGAGLSLAWRQQGVWLIDYSSVLFRDSGWANACQQNILGLSMPTKLAQIVHPIKFHFPLFDLCIFTATTIIITH